MHDRRGAVARRFSLGVALSATFAILVPPLPAGSDAGAPLTEYHRDWVWSSAYAVSGVGGLEAIDLDRDGQREILTTPLNWSYPSWVNGRWLQVRSGEPMEVEWTSLGYPLGLRLIRTIEIENRVEVVAIASTPFPPFVSRVFVHDGLSKMLLGEFSVAAGEVRSAVVEDLDSDGSAELAICDADSLFFYDYSSGSLIAVKEGFGCTDLSVGQVDVDPQLELALVGNPLGGFLLDGETFGVQWADLEGFGASALFVDVNADGFEELATGRDDEPILRVIELGTGESLWETEDWFRSLAAGDFDGDGQEEIVAGRWTLQIRDAATGVSLSEIPFGDLEVFDLAVGDVDADGFQEILISAFRDPGEAPRLLVADATSGKIEARADGLSGPFLQLFAVDAGGDGDLDLVTASASPSSSGPDPALVTFDLASRSIERLAEPLPGSEENITLGDLVIGQIDSDSPLEICYSLTVHSPTSSAIRCEDAATHEEEWQRFFVHNSEPTALLATEVDGEPGTEIIVGFEDGSVAMLDGRGGQIRWRSPRISTFRPVESVKTGTVSMGSETEVIVLLTHFSGSLLATLDASDGSISGGPWLVSAAAIDLASLDADAPIEIVLGDEFGDVTVFDPATGLEGEPLAQLGAPITAIRIGDSTRDGAMDLHAIAGNRLVIRELTGAGAEWVSDLIGFAAGAGERMAVGNIDIDPLPEIAVSTDYGFAIFEAPYELVFADGFESGDTSSWTTSVP